jgi:hypothetical protein
MSLVKLCVHVFAYGRSQHEHVPPAHGVLCCPAPAVPAAAGSLRSGSGHLSTPQSTDPTTRKRRWVNCGAVAGLCVLCCPSAWTRSRHRFPKAPPCSRFPQFAQLSPASPTCTSPVNKYTQKVFVALPEGKACLRILQQLLRLPRVVVCIPDEGVVIVAL